MKEDAMKKFAILMLVGATVVPTAAVAHDTETAFSSRGACEAASAGMSIDEAGWLLETFPEVFGTAGEVSSFLTRAWTCDRNDGQYYITDHRQEVLDSEWFAQRNH
jgi:hypothetical protein